MRNELEATVSNFKILIRNLCSSIARTDLEHTVMGEINGVEVPSKPHGDSMLNRTHRLV